MIANRNLFTLTARDVMCRHLTTIPVHSSLRDAASRLTQARVHGAPVVDDDGRCVGVLSTADLARWAINQDSPPSSPPKCCIYQEAVHEPGGQYTRCTLPAGSCPIQRLKVGFNGTPEMECAEPHYMLTDWQIVTMESLPESDVKSYMTTGAVTAKESDSIIVLAKKMTDYSVHRVIIVDDHDRPLGIVSISDIIAALATVDESVEENNPDPFAQAESMCVSMS